MREDIDLMRPFIEQQLLLVYEADSTRQVLKIVEDLMDGLEEVLDKDMLNTYFFCRSWIMQKLLISRYSKKRKSAEAE